MKKLLKFLLRINLVFLLFVTSFTTTKASVLIYEVASTNSYYTSALNALGKTVVTASSVSDFQTKLNDGTPWELAIYSEYSGSLTSTTITSIQTWVNTGGKFIFTHYDIDSYPTNTLFTSTMGFSWVSTFSTPYSFTPNSTSHAIFTTPNVVNVFNYSVNQNIDDGQLVTLTSGTSLATFNGTTNPAIILSSNGNIIFNAFQPCNFTNDADGDTKADMQELLENEISYLIVPQVPGIPVANFASLTSVFVGTPVNFFDQSSGVPTSWSWSFPGGTPSTSTLQNPVVTYNSEGIYNVSLTVTNSFGTDTEIKTAYIVAASSYQMPVTGTNSITTCGISLYDNGGSAGNYSDNSNSTLTIYPSSVGQAVKLTFNSFNIQSSDYLYVYNGTSTSAGSLGSFTGTTIPSAITALNSTGALTLRFYSTSSTNSSGFDISTSCVPLPNYVVSSASWGTTLDNDGDTYFQSRNLSYTVSNISSSSASLYAKIYYKLTSESTYTLLNTTSNFTVNGNSTYTASYSVTGLPYNSYDFQIELYNSSNVLQDTYNSLDNTILSSLEFELPSTDLYCQTSLGGSSFNISSVILSGTTLSNTTSHSGTYANGSYLNVFSPTGSNTGTVTKGFTYNLSVTSSSASIISVWIDFNQNGTFETSEWWQVATVSAAGSPSTVSILIPTTALTGETRMRIRTNSTSYTNNASSSCSNFAYGCTEDYMITIADQTPGIPVANFNVSLTNPATGQTVSFNDVSTGIPTSWSWTFQGGTPSTSTSQNPTVSYSTAGTYAVSLTVTNSFGTDTEIKTGFITVSNNYIMSNGLTNTITSCSLNIFDSGGSTGSYSNSETSQLTLLPVTAGNKVRLTFNTFYTQTSYDYVRVYDGTSTSATLIGSYSGSTIPSAITATNASGAITIQFTSDGSSYYSGFSITSSCVAPAIPVANFSANSTTPSIGQQITFSDLSTGLPTSWSWTFQGGTPSTSTSQNPTISYTTAGTYAVSLTATNSLGTDTETKTGYITVSNNYVMSNGLTNTITTCSLNIFDSGGSTGSYSISETSQLTILPATAGSKVRLTFNTFATESGYDYVRVYDGTSTSATLLGSYSGSSIPSVITATNIDGALTIRFTSDGSSNYSGFSITSSCYSTIPTMPVADFSASSTSVTTGQSVSFTDLTAGIPSSWSWSFPGGTPSTSTVQNPTVVYSTVGTYAVTLTATNTIGSDVETKTAYITVSNTYNMVSGTNSISTCGMTIYDNGGASGDYTNSLTSTLTINPSTVGQAVRLTFNSFQTESIDYLYVYNGTSTSATLIGSYSGSSIPAAITATNATGALTLRFSTDGSVVYSGYSITTSCVSLPNYIITSASWGTSVDNDGDLYYQSRILNYTANNTTATSATLYAKIYYKLTSSSTYTLAGTGSSFSVAASSTSTTQSYTLSNLPQGSYDIKIELYNSSNTLVDTYDLNDNSTVLSSIEFELPSTDLYCSSNLGGGSFDISSVTITGTTLNNTTNHTGTYANGSYLNTFTASGSNTASLQRGSVYTLNVTTTNSDIISVWFDFNQNGTFETTEWWQVATASSSGVASSVSITVPSTATLGQTKMRIRSRGYGNTNNSSSACANFSSGCTEDYTVTIASATPTVPIANFTASSTTVNVGSAITFTDLSTGIPTSWNWNFQGGSPVSSTSQNPVVTYNTVGTYGVTLTATNSLGSDVETKTAYITVTNSYIMSQTGTNSISTCGSLIYDNGGPTTNYSSGCNSTLTINPGTSGNAVRLTFNSFQTESGYDYLYVYDGTSTSATQVGVYSGSTLPSVITATNPTGALTIRFYSDGSNTYSGFEIATSCVELTDYQVTSASIISYIDYDDDNYYQNATLGYSVQNITGNTVNVYTKIYAQPIGSSSRTLLSRSSNFTILPTSVSSQQTAILDNLQFGLYNIIIEVYDAVSGDLITTYGAADNASLENVGFEPADNDVYCVSTLYGGSWDITRVSIAGTTLNNTSTRPQQLTNGSYYTFFPLNSGYTCTLEKGSTYQLNVLTTNNDIISMWIDYNQNGTFEASEHVQVSTASNANIATISFIVPTTALNGKTGLRIRTASSGSINGSTDACTIFYSGCTEDYEISIGVTTPQITFNGRILTSSALSGNQWYNQFGLIPGATNRSYTPTADGDYYVIVTTSNGASEPSNIISVVALDINTTKESEILLYPVPVTTTLTISNENNSDEVQFEICDIKGQIVIKDIFTGSTNIDTSKLPSGTYIIRLQIGTKKVIKTFIKK